MEHCTHLDATSDPARLWITCGGVTIDAIRVDRTTHPRTWVITTLALHQCKENA